MVLNVTDVTTNGYPNVKLLRENQLSNQLDVLTVTLLIGIKRDEIKGERMEITKAEMQGILDKPEIRNKVLNSFNEYLNWVNDLQSKGLQYEKTVKKFSNSSAAIYLPRRLVGKTFKVFLMPIHDKYEISEPTEKQVDKILRDTEKELENIQNDRRRLI
jgi:hypothetical protein